MKAQERKIFFVSVVDRQSFDTAPEDPTFSIDADPDPTTDPTIKLGKLKMKKKNFKCT